MKKQRSKTANKKMFRGHGDTWIMFFKCFLIYTEDI